MAAQHQQYGTAPGPQPPQMSLPLINGPGRGRGAGPMPPTLLQMPSVYPGNTGGRQPQPPAQPDFPVETGGWSTLASGIAADLRGQTHAADSAPPPDGCARCRIWNGAVRSAFLWNRFSRHDQIIAVIQGCHPRAYACGKYCQQINQTAGCQQNVLMRRCRGSSGRRGWTAASMTAQ